MKRIAFPAALLLLAFTSVAHAETPMDYMRTAGPAADPVTRLNWGLLIISLAVIVIISALVLYGCLRRRPPMQEISPGRLPVHPDAGGAKWIYIGVGISTVVLFFSTIWTINTLAAVDALHEAPALTVEVTGNQWWWEVRYEGKEPSQTMITANEIHIPVGEKVRVKLRAGDVIHSFWVPKLAGKTDMIPGQQNAAWLQADRPGRYRGECAEFCGAQHAHMIFYVVAEERPKFEAWWKRQLQPAETPQSPSALRGKAVFLAQCSACHTVRGTNAHGRLGPDLTHLMSRETIAAGMLPNVKGNLGGWVAHAQAIKPGTRMPSMNLSPEDLQDVIAYLQTLQ